MLSGSKTLLEGRYVEGKLAGCTEKAIEIAKKIKAAGMNVNTICEMTGLVKRELDRLRKLRVHPRALCLLQSHPFRLLS